MRCCWQDAACRGAVAELLLAGAPWLSAIGKLLLAGDAIAELLLAGDAMVELLLAGALLRSTARV